MNIYCVIPCYNEENRFAYAKFTKAVQLNPEVTFVFVDDGSTDETKEKLESFIKPFNNAKVVSGDENSGKANAIRLGFQYVESIRKKVTDEIAILIWTDADQQILFEDLQHMINKCRELANTSNELIVFATRNYVKSHHFVRTLGSLIISRVLRNAGKIEMPLDTQCGLKGFQISEVFVSAMRDEFETRWFIEWELFLRIYKLKQRLGRFSPVVVEIPLAKVEKAMDSHISVKNYISIFKEVLIIRKKIIRL